MRRWDNIIWDLLCHLTWIVTIVCVIENCLFVIPVNCTEPETPIHHSRIKRKAIPKDSQRWPRGFIPYYISEPLASDFVSKEAILESIETLQTDTCIRFKEISQDTANAIKHVRFVKADGCHSSVGNTDSKDFQVVSIGTSCGYTQMVLHELGHLIGLIHEHSRPDRDAHIMINWSNIYPDMAYNFDKAQDVRLLTPYDLSSFMHYGLKVFSHNKMYNSIMPIKSDLSFLVGYRPDLSFYDKLTINTLYQCSAHCQRYNPEVCENEGFLNQWCQCVCPRLFTGDRCETVLTDEDCGGVEYVTNQTTISTPNYPHHYRNRQTCVWYLKTSPDQVFEVEFEDFDLETGRYGTCRDQLEIRAHYIGLDRGKAYCGEHLNETIISTTNKLILNFQSSQTETRRGFRAKIRTLPKTDCSSSPCQNGGLCQPMENYPDYYCKCQGHWIGKDCHIPVLNGAFSEWGNWSSCTAACGRQCRHRECNNPAPQNGGTECTGLTLETRRCQPKDIDCTEQFICDFDHAKLCYGMWITGDKNMAWRTNVGRTPSMNTGPEEGHLGPSDGYLFMESSHGNTNDETVLWLPSNRWQRDIYCLQFYYHLYGMTSGSLRVLRRNSNNASPQILWQKSNNHGNQWIEANLNIHLYEEIELGFVGIKGPGYYSDMAIDDISVSPGACKLPRDSYARGCVDGEDFHYVGPVSRVQNCKNQTCMCNPDGELDCPEWDWEDVCEETDLYQTKVRKQYKYRPAFPLRRKNKNKKAGNRGSTNQHSTRVNQVDKKKSGQRKDRKGKKIRLVSFKKKPSLRLIGSGEVD